MQTTKTIQTMQTVRLARRVSLGNPVALSYSSSSSPSPSPSPAWSTQFRPERRFLQPSNLIKAHPANFLIQISWQAQYGRRKATRSSNRDPSREAPYAPLYRQLDSKERMLSARFSTLALVSGWSREQRRNNFVCDAISLRNSRPSTNLFPGLQNQQVRVLILYLCSCTFLRFHEETNWEKN